MADPAEAWDEHHSRRHILGQHSGVVTRGAWHPHVRSRGLILGRPLDQRLKSRVHRPRLAARPGQSRSGTDRCDRPPRRAPAEVVHMRREKPGRRRGTGPAFRHGRGRPKARSAPAPCGRSSTPCAARRFAETGRGFASRAAPSLPRHPCAGSCASCRRGSARRSARRGNCGCRRWSRRRRSAARRCRACRPARYGLRDSRHGGRARPLAPAPGKSGFGQCLAQRFAGVAALIRSISSSPSAPIKERLPR